VPFTSLTSHRPIPADHERVMAVMPAWRGGREPYRRFAADVRERGRTRALAKIEAQNVKSIAFPQRSDVTLEQGDEIIDGLPVRHDAAGAGFDFVIVVRRLDEGTSR
jgi:hypothetical protein